MKKTARLYTDLFLFTSNKSIVGEVQKVFDFFERTYHIRKYSKLMVAPFYMRSRINRLISREVKNARAGKKAWIFFKMNSLVDKKIIKKALSGQSGGSQDQVNCARAPAHWYLRWKDTVRT